MFVKACEEARHFTRPVVISTRRLSGDVETGLAAFVLLNAEGWIVSTAHVMSLATQAQEHATLVQAYEQELAAIDAGPGTDSKKAFP